MRSWSERAMIASRIRRSVTAAGSAHRPRKRPTNETASRVDERWATDVAMAWRRRSARVDTAASFTWLVVGRGSVGRRRGECYSTRGVAAVLPGGRLLVPGSLRHADRGPGRRLG